MENGNLELRSAHDKNILVKLNGKGTFMVNNVDILHFIHGADYANSSAAANGNALITIKELFTQMTRMRSWIRGKKGIIARLDRLENG